MDPMLGTEVTSSDVGGFVAGDTVVASRDLRVRGRVVVRQAEIRLDPHAHELHPPPPGHFL